MKLLLLAVLAAQFIDPISLRVSDKTPTPSHSIALPEGGLNYELREITVSSSDAFCFSVTVIYGDGSVRAVHDGCQPGGLYVLAFAAGQVRQHGGEGRALVFHAGAAPSHLAPLVIFRASLTTSSREVSAP